MKLLIVGSGAREHCLVWKARQSPLVTNVYCAPGNAGTALLAENVPVAADDIDGLANWAVEHQIDLTMVGPEAPLVAGIADSFAKRRLTLFGPSRAAARIEGSKIWSKELMLSAGVPTPRAAIFDNASSAKRYLAMQLPPVVVKADGLAAGKGVVVAATLDEARQAIEQIMESRSLGAAGDRVLIEECLSGPEVSVLALTDGDAILPLPPACDYKRIADGDKGPNTGGMGAYSPPKFVTPSLLSDIVVRILRPTVNALAKEGAAYKGILYAGLMLTTEGPMVLEYNCRFGDPETQVILPRLRSDLVELALATATGHLSTRKIEWDDRPCCGVVLASGGYPGEYHKGVVITGLDNVPGEVEVFHAGTAQHEGKVVTAGGRVLTVVAKGATMAEARSAAYRGVASIGFDGRHFRRDIGLREL